MAGKPGARILKTRWLVRAPIALLRAGLVFLFGGQLMMLEQVGRTSGEPRYIVLEVLTRPNSNEMVIASGLGRQSQWFQNIVANPNCHVSIGARRRVLAAAAVLPDAEASEVLADFQAAHPKLWGQLDAAMIEVNGREDYELPLVRLTLEPRSRL